MTTDANSRKELTLVKPYILMIAAWSFLGCEAPTPPTERPAPAFVLDLEPRMVPPGEERRECFTVAGPTTDLFVSRYLIHKETLHHVSLWRESLPCAGKASSEFLFQSLLAGDAEDSLEGAAILLKAGEPLVLDVHYLNVSSQEKLAVAHVELFAAEPGAELALPLILTMDPKDVLGLAPGRSTEKAFSCAAPAELSLLRLSTHGHSHNRSSWIDLDGTEIYRSDNWREPELGKFPALAVRAGSVARFHCLIENQGSTVVNWGPSVVTDEMCTVAGLTTGASWICQGHP